MASGNEIPKDKQHDGSIPLQGGDFRLRHNEVVNSVGSNMIDVPVQYTFMPEVSRSYVAPEMLLGGLDVMSNVDQFSNSSNSQIDLNIGQDWGGMALSNSQFSGFASFEVNPGDVCGPVCPDSFDNVPNRSTDFSGFQNLMEVRRDEHADLLHTTQQSGHINSSGIVWPQSNTNFMRSDAVSVPVRFHNLLGRGPEGADNVWTGSNPSLCPERVDDTVLALGTQFTKPDFSAQFREYKNGDKSNFFPDLNTPVIQNVSQSLLRHNQYGNNGISSLSNSVGGFSNRAQNLVDLALYNNSGATYGTNTGLGVNSSQISELSHLGTQHFLPIPSSNSFSLEGNNKASPTDFSVNRGTPDHFSDFSINSRAYDGYQGDGNYGRQAKMPRLTLQSAKTMIPSSQPSSNQIQKQVVKLSGMTMLDPIIISPTNQAERSSSKQDQFGALTRSKEGGIVHEPQDFLQRPTNIGQVIPFKKRTGLSKALNVSFSSPNDVPSQHHSTGLGIQNSVPHNNVTGQVIPMLKPNAEGQASSVLSGFSNKNSSLKHPPFIPVHLPVAPNVPGSTINNGNEVKQVPTSLKRRTSPLVTSNVQAQRRKITPQSVKELSVPPVSRIAQPGRRPTQLGSQIIQPGSQTVQPAYIKKRETDGPAGLPLTGEKCPLCKRDLSYMPEGHMYQPSVPPAVAVLPCHHVFHDYCLQLITPPDQSKHPPCIPCAIGE